MIVGVPGSGIGGLYYILLGLSMPFCELVQAARGRSSWKRWRTVGVQSGHAMGVLWALAGSGWVMQAVICWMMSLLDAPGSQAVAEARRRMMAEKVAAVGVTWTASLSLATLLVVALLPAVLAWGLTLRERMAAKRLTGPPCAKPELGLP